MLKPIARGMCREVRSCQAHTDTMVELRYSLWRIPMAFHTMVTTVEEENTNKVVIDLSAFLLMSYQEKNCKIRESTLILPDVVMREKRSGADKSKRNSLYRKSQVIQGESFAYITCIPAQMRMCLPFL